jgi:hypothetical protein
LMQEDRQMDRIRESDWRRFRELHEIVLDRFCKWVFADVEKLLADTRKTHHERYGALYGLIQDRDKLMATLFDDMSRSNALLQLAGLYRHKLVTAEELSSFSEETRAFVKRIVSH